MTNKEIEQLIKDIPDEIFEIPQFGKLIHNTFITHKIDSCFISSLFNDIDIKHVVLNITTGSVPIATFKLFEDMSFILIFHIENSPRLTKYLKTQIPDVLARISTYLTMIGFKEIK